MKKLIVYILAVVTAMESLSIDLYLPAFSAIAQTLNSSIGSVQISLSLFLAGFASGQLLWGPLSDMYGRKPVLIIGLSIFVASSIAIHFVASVEWLWLLRFLQAFGGCAGIVMSRAIVADIFDKEHTIKIFADQAQINGIAPIIAPLLGSLLLTTAGWKSIFSALSILGLACILATVIFIPESFKKNDRLKSEGFSLSALLRSALLNRQFVLYTLVGAMAYSALMLYISSAPFVLMEKLGLSETDFSLAFGFNSLALILASYITPKLLSRYQPKVLVVWASLGLAAACFCFAIIMTMYLHVGWIIFQIHQDDSTTRMEFGFSEPDHASALPRSVHCFVAVGVYRLAICGQIQ